MTTDEFKVKLQKFKQLNPQFAHLSDEEAARLYLKVKASRQKLPSTIHPDQAKAAVEQTETLGKVANFEAARSNLVTAREAQKLVPLQSEANQQSQRTLIAQSKNTETVAEEATANGIDVLNFGTARLHEITEKTRIESRAHEIRQDIERAQQLEAIRLEGYQQEVQIDIQAITTHRLLAHSTVLGVSAHLQELIVQRESILRLDVSEDTKRQMLRTQDDLITAFRKNLDVQIQRHLLEAGNEKDMGRDKEDTESG